MDVWHTVVAVPRLADRLISHTLLSNREAAFVRRRTPKWLLNYYRGNKDVAKILRHVKFLTIFGKFLLERVSVSDTKL